jgi:hypothetical protein
MPLPARVSALTAQPIAFPSRFRRSGRTSWKAAREKSSRLDHTQCRHLLVHANFYGGANFGEYGAARRGLPDRDLDWSIFRELLPWPLPENIGGSF